MAKLSTNKKDSLEVIAPRPAAKVTSEEFAAAFGASAVFSAPAGQSPLARWQFVKEIQALMASSGGRPSLESSPSKT